MGGHKADNPNTEANECDNADEDEENEPFDMSFSGCGVLSNISESRMVGSFRSDLI